MATVWPLRTSKVETTNRDERLPTASQAVAPLDAAQRQEHLASGRVLGGSGDLCRGHARCSSEQPARVLVLRGADHLGGGTLLHDLAAVHDDDSVGPLGGEGEVVGDEQNRRAELVGELLHLVQHEALHGDVEGRGGLVGDEKLRATGQRHRDEDALAHAAGELVRVLLEARGGIRDPCPLQQPDGLVARLLSSTSTVHLERLDDLGADLHRRVEVGHRVLRHHPDAAPADRGHRFLPERGQLGAVEPDASGADAAVGGQQPVDRRGESRLARARLADHATVSPRPISRLTPRTAATGPWGVSNSTVRSLTVNSGWRTSSVAVAAMVVLMVLLSEAGTGGPCGEAALQLPRGPLPPRRARAPRSPRW